MTAPATTATRARDRALRRTIGAAAGARIVTGLALLVQTPLLIGHLGLEVYGWLTALVAFIGLSSFADGGAGMALQQEIAEAWARDDRARVRQLHASGVRLLGLLGGGCFLLAAPAAWWWGDLLLPAPLGDAAAARLGWLVVALAAGLGVPASSGPRLAAALQLGWIAAGWNAVGSVGVLVGLVLVLPGHGCPPAVVLALLATGAVLPGWATALHVRRRLGWRGRTPREPGGGARLWRAGLPYAVAHLGGAAVQLATPTLFAWWGGYAAAAGYAVAQRLVGLVQQTHALVLAPLWPAFAEAAVRREAAWIGRALRGALLASAAASLGLALVLAALPWAGPVWVGPAATLAAGPLRWWLLLWSAAAMFSQALAYYLAGLGRLPGLACGIGLAHAATLGLMSGLGAGWGGPGVAAALALGGTGLLLPQFVRATLAARKESTAAPRDATL